jgi:hypothetical protein
VDGREVKTPAEVIQTLSSKRAGQEASFVFRRGDETKNVSGSLIGRPLQKPDGFEVVYDQVVSKGNRIRIIITLPDGNTEPAPTLFMIGGIGAYSIDGDFATSPYGKVLDPIAKGGYATVRVEKPGMGDSEGPAAYTDLMFDDELDAYIQALRLIKTNPRINKDRIVIFGHSMGGAFGPLVAQAEPVKGIMVHGTMSKTWTEYVIENTRRQYLLAGASPGDLDEAMKGTTSLAKYLFIDGMSPTEIQEKVPALVPTLRGMIPDGKTYSGVNIKFFQQLAQKNLPAAWEKFDGSVLALWGENDYISTEWDHSFIAEIVNRRTPGKGTFKVVPQSDHGFFKTSSPQDSRSKWGRPGNMFNQNIVEILAEWIKTNI